MNLRWRFGIIAGFFLAVCSLYPQGKLIYNRGWSDWNGHYAYNDIDEVAYASYVNALIDGRPRKNDPYTGRDDSVQTPQAESLFSIQFAAPYTIALPARLLGVGAPWAMTIGGAVAAFLTGLAIFWLIGMITRGDSLYAMADALIVICLGALFAGEGAIGEILGNGFSYPYFPGFRRYIPALALPAFFVLVAIVWRQIAAHDGDEREAPRSFPVLPLVAAVACFAYCVYSYFYVWTSAAAWLGCFTILLLILRPAGLKRDLIWLGGLGVLSGLALLPYAYLLSNRTHTLDDVQMLVLTHRFDLTRTPELIGFLVIGVILAAAVMGVFRLPDRSTIFALSLALTPALLFNQQVLTGRELQPIHYQVFIGNYIAGLAVVVTFALLWNGIQGRERMPWRLVVAGFATAAALWGIVECHYTVRVLDDVNVARDEAFPLGRRLRELAASDSDAQHHSVLYFPIAEADDLPTLTRHPVLWARHQHVFAGVSWQENKERYYQQMYYDNVSAEQLAEGIKHGGDVVSMIALFGWGRHTDRLNSAFKPLTFREIDEEAANYAAYIDGFSPEQGVPLSYMVTTTDDSPDNHPSLGRWYESYDREDLGRYSLYKLRRR